jgi:AbrB family looped-hinge helix DNA binding protein
MRSSGIAIIDSKGRILIPSYLRKTLNMKDGTEIILFASSDKSELRMLPLVKGKSAKIKLILTDLPDSLANIAGVLDVNNVKIITSESRSISGNLTEWNLVVDISRYGSDFDCLKSSLMLDTIRSVELSRV